MTPMDRRILTACEECPPVAREVQRFLAARRPDKNTLMCNWTPPDTIDLYWQENGFEIWTSFRAFKVEQQGELL